MDRLKKGEEATAVASFRAGVQGYESFYKRAYEFGFVKAYKTHGASGSSLDDG